VSSTQNQPCSADGCDAPAIFRARSRAAWCEPHTREVFRRAGVELLETPMERNTFALTRCIACGCEAHYRIDYAVEKTHDRASPFGGDEGGVCRACFWRDWAAKNRRNLVDHAPDLFESVPRSDAEETAKAHGYEYLGPLTTPSLPDDPHHVRCKYCNRLSALRLSDIGFGCSCQVNASRSATTPVRKDQVKALLRESGLRILAAWDHDHNAPELWQTATIGARREAAWVCTDCGLPYMARVDEMVKGMAGCPDCRERELAALVIQQAERAVRPVAEVPELVRDWDNYSDPRSVMVGTIYTYRFTCSNGHHPNVTPGTYLDRGCYICRQRGLPTGPTTDVAAQLDEFYRELASTVTPQDAKQVWRESEMATQWHPSRNLPLTVDDVGPASRRQVWWRAQECGHEWAATPRERGKRERRRCPVCRTILDSLAYHYPELADEWAPSNPVSPWHVRPTGKLSFTPEWVCAVDATHKWRMATSARVQGAQCPECQPAGKSRIELLYCDAAAQIFGNASSGRLVTSHLFDGRSSWRVDIAVDLPDGRLLFIEYDGSYWHAADAKRAVDQRKTTDLLALDALVVRFREHPLTPLGIQHPRYREFTVYGDSPRVRETLEGVLAWMRQTPAHTA